MRYFNVIVYLLMLSLSAGAQLVPDVYINEFMASNVSTEADMLDHDDFTDWIELFNYEDSEVDISGFFITDDRDETQKWQFPEGTYIPPGGFLRIWADGNDDIPGQHRTRSWRDINGNPIPYITDYHHLNFNLRRSGEFIGLYTADGVLVDSIGFDLQYRDISRGRQPDGSQNWYFFGEPTPGKPNTTKASLEAVFSGESSIEPHSTFFSGVLSINMNPSATGDSIFYQTGGSKPSSIDSCYSDPFDIKETTLLRARLYEENKLPGPISFRSWLYDEQSALPVLSILCPPESLWGHEKGIYENKLKGREIPVSLDYFNENLEPVLSMQAGLRLSGQASLFYPQVSLTLSAKDRFGKDAFEYPFFPEREIASFKSLYLRNGGFPDQRDTYFRDALQSSLVIGLIDLDVQAYHPVTVFLNGEYWGIYNIREKIDADFLSALHNINPDDIDLLEYEAGNDQPVVMEGNADDYLQLYDFISEHDLTTEENYETVCKHIDIQSFINYQVCNIYYDNVFWQAENVRMWRERKAGSKWRWILFDNDWSFGLQPNPRSSGYSNNTLEFATSSSSSIFNPPEWSTRIFTSLLQNEDFKTRFMQSFDIYMNSIFHPDTVIATINDLQLNIASEMSRHIDRWKDGDTYLTPPLSDYPTWLDKVEVMREFARNRPGYQRQVLADYFSISGETLLELKIQSSGNGKVRINDAITFDQDISGNFFRDIPLELYAIPEVGYRFAGWEGDINDTLNKLSLNLNQDSISLIANFEPIDISIIPGMLTKDTVLTRDASPWYATGDIIVDSNVTLTLEDGVTIYMPEEACILVYGQLLVNGTDQYLVRISPNEYTDKWGALCFINATDSSVIKNLVIRAATNGHNFERDKAAISAYNSNLSLEFIAVFESEAPIFIQKGNVMIHGCMLTANEAGDLINVKAAEQIIVEDCDLLGGDYYDSDAIDYDQLSKGIIRGNLIRSFYGSNSDAIDLGEDSHDILIEENIIANINDKGISIGNGSNGIIRRNVFVNCGQGIGVKDYQSYGYAEHNTFYGNQYGIASFVKNTGEGGGTIDVINSIFSHSKLSPVLVDELSVARVNYSLSSTELLEGQFNIQEDPLLLNELRLISGSPAINAGNPALPNDPDGSPPDLGAYPFNTEDENNILINEIHYHPSEGESYQFIELYNAGASRIDLYDYSLEGSVQYAFPDLSLAVDEYLLIAANPTFYLGHGYQVLQWDSGNLNNFPGRIQLKDAQGFTVDNIDFSNESWWPSEPDGQGPSLELCSPRLENMASSSWRSSYSHGGTPGGSNNSLIFQGIYINEFMASNNQVIADEFEEYDDWIELYNSTDDAIPLEGLYLTDQLDNPMKHRIPMNQSDSTIIPPKGYLLFWADGQPEQGAMHLNFVLSRSGEEIGLAQWYENELQFIDSLSYGEQISDTSQGRYPDGSNSWYAFDEPTPRSSNQYFDGIDTQLLPDSHFSLANYPNPFQGETTLRYKLTNAGMTCLSIYDFTGRKVAILINSDQQAGEYELCWDASNLQAGIYYCELKTGYGKATRKMVLMK